MLGVTHASIMCASITHSFIRWASMFTWVKVWPPLRHHVSQQGHMNGGVNMNSIVWKVISNLHCRWLKAGVSGHHNCLVMVVPVSYRRPPELSAFVWFSHCMCSTLIYSPECLQTGNLCVHIHNGSYKEAFSVALHQLKELEQPLLFAKWYGNSIEGISQFT